MTSRRITITSRSDLTERNLLFDEHFDERVKLAFELDSNVFLYYYNGTTKISEFGALSDGEKLTFSTEDIPDGIFTDMENAVKNGRAKRANGDDKRKFKLLEQTANSLYSNQQSEPSPQVIKSPKGRVGRQQKPLDITGAPGYEKLIEDERTLCTALRLTPQLYLDIKTVLTSECAKQGYLKKQQARSLIKIDVNKTAAIFDFLQEHGWINNGGIPSPHLLQQQQPMLQQTMYLPQQQTQQQPMIQQPSFLQQQHQFLQQQQVQLNNDTLQQTHEQQTTTSLSSTIQTQQPQLMMQQQQLQQQPVQQQQRLSLLPQQLPHAMVVPVTVPPKFKQEHMNSAALVQQPPTKKVKRENTQPTTTLPNKQQQLSQQQQQQSQQSNNPQQTSNVVYERVYFSYQTKGNQPPHPSVFYAIPQPIQNANQAHTHMQTTHHIQQTNSHIVGPNNQHHQTQTQQQQHTFSYTPQSDDNIQHPQDSSSGEEPVLDLWDPAALQHHDQQNDHWGSVLDVQARDSLTMQGFNPNYPQANLQYTQYVPDDVANMPFPTGHQ